MRRILVTLLLSLVAFAAPAYAGPCSIDGATYEDDMAFVPCPIGDTNNFLIDAGYNSARLPQNVTLSQTPIYVHNTCRYVDSRGTDAPLFIPFNTATEWLAFLNADVKGVHTAECCVPRPLRVNDVPLPTETCSSGWQFVGLADPSDTSRVIATQMGTGFAFVAGMSENASYPIQKLPLQRDDVGAQVPQDGLNAYVGKFYCAGEVDFSTSTSPVVLSNGGGSWSEISGSGNEVFVTGGNANPVAGKASNVTKFMGFTMQCANHDWKHTSPSCFGKTTGIQISQCPNNSTGRIVTSIIRQCDGTTVSQVTENTCQKNCAPKTVTTEERQCPDGKLGKVTVQVTKSCFGRQPVGNQSYGGGSCDCTTSEKIVGDTCRNACVPYTDLGTEERQCPEGETGKIKVKKKRLCHEAEDCGETQCICEDKEEVVENTCKKICPPYTDLGTETRNCPPGQEGAITVKKTRECREENQCGDNHNHGNQSYGNNHNYGSECKCTNKETVLSNTCHNVCQPYERDETFPCPAGEEGSIVKTFRRICDCPGGREEVVVKSNTCKPSCPVGRRLIRTWKDSCLGGKKVYEEYEVTYVSSGDECADGSYRGLFDALGLEGGESCEKAKPGQCMKRIETIRVKNSCWFSPLVLDLGGDGLELSSLEDSGVKFDMDLDGVSDPTGWVGKQEAFLVLDKNNDGVINNRSEMFGNLDAFENGFSLLASFDDNADGVIDNRDWVFPRLRVWIDSNGDAVSQPDELLSLASMDIASINLTYTSPGTVLNGNLLGQQSSFTYGSGKTADVFDVWFTVEGSAE